MAPSTHLEARMKARYIGAGYGNWKGIEVSPGREFDVPERLQEIVAGNANFEILTEQEAPEKRKPGRPRKSDENAE